MRSIAVVNQKGGCGKTITAINLSAFLAQTKRVLLIDMDPQGHATLGVSSNPIQYSKTMYDFFIHDGAVPRSLANVIYPISENLDLAPSDIVLSAVPEKLSGIAGRENILADALLEIRDRYDYVIVDCPPGISLLTFNALKAGSEAIVPMDPSFFSLHGIGKVFETFDVLDRTTGHHISARVLVTLFPGRSPFVKAVLEDVHSHLAGRCYETVIRYSVKLAEAASHGLPITQYCRQCAGYDDYQALANEVLQRIGDVQSDAAERSEIQTIAPGQITVRGNQRVMFSVEAPEARRVQLLGDFQGWTLEGSEMERDGRVWRKALDLEPGRYLYRFLVDGHWQSDPLNPVVEPCPGGYNSVLVLETRPAEARLN